MKEIIPHATLAISGSRALTTPSDRQAVLTILGRTPRPAHILVGDCPTGVDRITRDFATDNHIPCTVFEADWSTFGRSAGPKRNRQMVAGATALLAIKKAEAPNRGTSSAIREAERLTLPVVVHTVATT